MHADKPNVPVFMCVVHNKCVYDIILNYLVSICSPFSLFFNKMVNNHRTKAGQHCSGGSNNLSINEMSSFSAPEQNQLLSSRHCNQSPHP